MSSDAELLRSHLHLALRSQSQARIREFGGYAVGKRRNPNAIYPMSKNIAERLCSYMIVKAPGGDPASPEGVATAVARALQNVSDEMAYKLTSRDDRTWRQLCEDVAVFLEGCITFEGKPPETSLFVPSNGNGWKSWEAVSHRKLAYKWRHSWKEKDGTDFVAFDDDERQIGRIFRLQNRSDRWYWIVAAEGGRKLNWPTAGHEETAYLASRRLEMVYENITSGERRNEG